MTAAPHRKKSTSSERATGYWRQTLSNGRIDFSLGEQFVAEETYEVWMRRGFPEREGTCCSPTGPPLGEVRAIVDARVALAQRLILLKPDSYGLVQPYPRIGVMSTACQRARSAEPSQRRSTVLKGDTCRSSGEVRVAVPTQLEAQRRFVARRRAAESIRASAVDSFRAISPSLLAERRQALITAAVTGELPVPVAA